ncbi:MAG: hypothetical protein MHM6MM_001462 [Cercozoa sp. M6MM]
MESPFVEQDLRRLLRVFLQLVEQSERVKKRSLPEFKGFDSDEGNSEEEKQESDDKDDDENSTGDRENESRENESHDYSHDKSFSRSETESVTTTRSATTSISESLHSVGASTAVSRGAWSDADTLAGK